MKALEVLEVLSESALLIHLPSGAIECPAQLDGSGSWATLLAVGDDTMVALVSSDISVFSSVSDETNKICDWSI